MAALPPEVAVNEPRPIPRLKTPGVLAEIEAGLPKGFPDPVAGPVLQGLERAARQLAGG